MINIHSIFFKLRLLELRLISMNTHKHYGFINIFFGVWQKLKFQYLELT